MKALLTILLALTLTAGAFFFMTAGTPAEGPRAVHSAVATPGSSLEERVAGLEQSLEMIAIRLQALEIRPVLTQTPSPEPTGGRVPVGVEQLDLEETLHQLAAALENPAQAQSPELESLIVAVVEGREARAEAEREEERRQVLEDAVNERMLELRHELGLNDQQAEDMRGLLLAQQEKREEIFDRMRTGTVPDRRGVRDEMRTVRDEFHTEVQLVLAAPQYERFLELERASSDFGFGGGRRGEGQGGRQQPVRGGDGGR